MIYSLKIVEAKKRNLSDMVYIEICDLHCMYIAPKYGKMQNALCKTAGPQHEGNATNISSSLRMRPIGLCGNHPMASVFLKMVLML